MNLTLCPACVHYRFDFEQGKAVCAAFPNGIPEAIAKGGFDHRAFFPDDHGIRFDPLPGQELYLAQYEHDIEMGLHVPPSVSDVKLAKAADTAEIKSRQQAGERHTYQSNAKWLRDEEVVATNAKKPEPVKAEPRSGRPVKKTRSLGR